MKKVTPMKAIRLKCIDCCAGQILEVNKCHLEKCPLWIYRTGHRPKNENMGDFEGDIDSDGEIIDESILD